MVKLSYHQRAAVFKILRKYFHTSTVVSLTRSTSTSATTAWTVDSNKVSVEVEAKPFSDIPGPRCLPIVGGIWNYILPGGEFYGLSLSTILENLHQKYGPVVKETLAPHLKLVRLYDPNDIATVYRSCGKCPKRDLGFEIWVHYNEQKKFSQGLVNSQDEEWYQLRAQLNKKMLKKDAASGYLVEQAKVADDFLKHIRNLRDPRGDITNILPEVCKYTAEAVGVICFNRKLGAFTNNREDSETAKYIRSSQVISESLKVAAQSLPLYRVFKTKSYSKFCEALTFLRSLAEKYSKVSKLANNTKMVDAGGNLVKYMETETNLTQDQINSVIVEFVHGGVDTTGSMLTFLLYQIAKNKEAQDRLVAEIDSVFPDSSPLTFEGIHGMSYLRAVVRESQRLMPVTGGNGRRLTSDVICGGYHIPKGTYVWMANDIISRYEDHYKDADRFIPERWIRNHPAQESVHPFAFLPFGFGARACLGKRFAKQVAYIATVKILQKYRLEYNNEPIKLEYGFIYSSDKPINIRFVERK